MNDLLEMLGVAAIILAISCSGSMDHEVKGGTTNTVVFDEKFCDPSTYPDVASRRACKDAVLAAMKCHQEK